MKEHSDIDNQKNTTLIIVTESFPYGNGEQFIETEIYYAARFFNHVILIPKTVDGKIRPIPKNTSVVHPDNKRKMFVNWINMIQVFFYGFFWSEMISLLSHKISLYSILKLLRFTYQALYLKRIIVNLGIENSTVYYSYWLWSQAMALALISRSYKKSLFISRAHGYEVYENQHSDRYLPYRRFIFRYLDDVYFISKNGMEHAKNVNPSSTAQFHVARLGVAKQPVLPEDAHPSFLHIVSCSTMIPLKQIDHIIHGIALAVKETGKEIHWTHIGDGVLKEELIRLAQELGVMSYFTGSLTNQQVLDFYRNHPVDIFINASYSEGVPVSIMEAQSFGIPVIAPAIGGIPEIISDINGALIDLPVTPEKIKQKICDFLTHPVLWKEKKRRSLEKWNELMSAEQNYLSFYRNILNKLYRK